MKNLSIGLIALLSMLSAKGAYAHTCEKNSWTCDLDEHCVMKAYDCRRYPPKINDHGRYYTFQARAQWHYEARNKHKCFNSEGTWITRTQKWLRVNSSVFSSQTYTVHEPLGPGDRIKEDLLRMAEAEALRRCETEKNESFENELFTCKP
jgi:hypothetical protein